MYPFSEEGSNIEKVVKKAQATLLPRRLVVRCCHCMTKIKAKQRHAKRQEQEVNHKHSYIQTQ